jgi:hypothetical protein
MSKPSKNVDKNASKLITGEDVSFISKVFFFNFIPREKEKTNFAEGKKDFLLVDSKRLNYSFLSCIFLNFLRFQKNTQIDGQSDRLKDRQLFRLREKNGFT